MITLLFPITCKICENPIQEFSLAPVCQTCLEAPVEWTGKQCERCGLLLISSGSIHKDEFCRLCRKGVFRFEKARSFGLYEGRLRDLIQRLKYDGLRPLAKPLGRLLRNPIQRFNVDTWDVILPVPLHARRQRHRGFNQSALLAQEISRMLGIALSKDCVRVRDTPPQTGLRAAERRKNVTGAFLVPNPEKVRSLRVLLVDDVITTGATANACA
ncbi:MAG: hypothetical protein A3F68_12840 [Acidobacteria bacterium RIFCSPLOWO2_12_FULL_54_10]|nr:MAG: hypothetical protein A3F68_12840 [Acidobacteria bacterium RIFCSPLOWO2_12_FULL_54_10]